ncbi:MAG: helix-turn-helix domain-containing protein [Sciscionella sp.]|nr:helix-turn-helix domain-containing protein [Sciscionella sp.]
MLAATAKRTDSNNADSTATEPETPANGVLVVRTSAAKATVAAIAAGAPVDRAGKSARQPETLQLVLRAALPRGVGATGIRLAFPGCDLAVKPVDGPEPEHRRAAVLLTVDISRLTVNFAELQPLLFQPVPVDRALVAVFSSAIAHVLSAGDALERHGVGHHLVGLTELVLRSALRQALDRADALATRRREAIAYIKAHLADPGLSAERIADALFISRRRLYQLFDDGDGVSGRIRQLRIELAKSLLGDPAHAQQGVGEIAKRCGFVNSAHFSRTFHKVVGQPPREFRATALRSSSS